MNSFGHFCIGLALLLVSVSGAKATATPQFTYIDVAENGEFESDVRRSVRRILRFSANNHLGLSDYQVFLTGAVLYGTKSAFDKFISSQPVPATFVGAGLDKKIHIVAWPVFKQVFPDSTRVDYERVITHEIAHLFHIAYLHGNEDAMGPIWFFEGFACLVAGQFPGEPLPPHDQIRVILRSPDRGSYKSYVSIVRGLANKRIIGELLDDAQHKDFSETAEKLLTN